MWLPPQGVPLLLRALLNASVLGMVSLVSGCHSVYPVTEPLTPGSGTVELRLISPRTIEARRPDGSRVTLDAVTAARGRPIRVRGDSAVIQIESWRGGTPPSDHREQPWVEAALKTSDPELRIFQKRISSRKTLLTLAIIVGVISLGVGQASVGGY